MPITMNVGDEILTDATPTLELRWELQNPGGVRTRRWRLMQKHIVTTHRLISKNGAMEAVKREEEWRPVPVAMPPDEITVYSRAHAGFVPQALDVEGELQ